VDRRDPVTALASRDVQDDAVDECRHCHQDTLSS
jgi:hypothetical protein